MHKFVHNFAQNLKENSISSYWGILVFTQYNDLNINKIKKSTIAFYCVW